MHEPLAGDDTHAGASELIHGLIDRVVLHPGVDGPGIELVGDIAVVLAIALPEQRNAARAWAADSEAFRSSVRVVAGVGFEPTTFRL
jgi:site-specific DNA recombinase